MKKNPQTKARQKRVLALVKTKFPRRRKGWGLIVLPFLCCLPLLSNANYTRHHPGMNKLSMSESPTNDTKKETIVIRGIGKDKEGNPLPGVTILIKGSTVGVSTDVKGEYVMNVEKRDSLVLSFSFVGMKTKEVKVTDDKPLQIVLEEDVTEVEEVVVNGIFQRKAGSFTGSALTMKGEDLKKVSNSNVFASLKNLDPSLMIFDNLEFGSDPNKMPTMALRGKTAFDLGSDDIDLKGSYANDPNAPLFILDGFETTLATISDLSMDRVESITVLKDAAATAIYGAKAANGVVVVETKAPAAGTLRLNYNGNLNFTFADLSDYNLMNSAEKLEFERLAGYYGDLDVNGEIVSEGNQQLYYQRLAEVKRGVDTYWMSEPLRFATSHSHNLFAEGGDDRMRYGIGFSYNKTQGVMKGSDRDVLNGNVRLMYRYKTVAFTNYLNLDYTMSSRENVSFSEFSRANPYHRKLNVSSPFG